jgi:hypothetical protein
MNIFRLRKTTWQLAPSGMQVVTRIGDMVKNVTPELSRRDDLECLAHILIYLMKGKLPWQREKTE